MIRARGLGRRFGDKRVLRDLDLDVQAGGFLLITGPNGSGKSTFLALVAGLLIASSLGLGLVIAAVSDSEPQTVQLSLLVLLASVFFSGFVLAISEFSEPVRSLVYLLPVASGIRLFGDFMFRGGTVVLWQLWLLAGLSVAYIAGAWLLLRRVVSRA